MTVDEIKIRLESIAEWLDEDLPTEGDVRMAKAEIAELRQLLQAAVSEQSKQLIALHIIEKICDNQNPTHEEIWKIAYGAIKEALQQQKVRSELANQECIKELLDYIDSFKGSGHDYWWINSKIRDKVYWMLKQDKCNNH